MAAIAQVDIEAATTVLESVQFDLNGQCLDVTATESLYRFLLGRIVVEVCCRALRRRHRQTR